MSYHISVHHVTPANTECSMMTFEAHDKTMSSAHFRFNDLEFDVFFDSKEDLRLSLEKIMVELARFVDKEMSMSY